MKPNVFMSYSRREVGFVDDLTNRLEKAGFKVWLDYRSLIPGTPWAGQIAKGLDEAQVIVLVVSKSSIASQYVEMEWRRVLSEKDKRIILAIFEAVDLPPELEKFEWVDFRGDYEAGIKELTGQLETPVQEEHPVPETGFKIPAVVWWSMAVSVVTGFLSLFAFLSILLPLILVPLAYRIYKRDFNFAQVQAALALMPFALFFFGIINPHAKVLAYMAFISVVPCVVLIFLLRSKGMQRWGKPEATMSKFSNPYRPNNPNPQPVSFFIDHAAHDRHIAKDMAKTLIKHRHPQAADAASAQAVFVLVSAYKTDSEADPEKQAVFPVLVQAAQPSEKLSHIQWIDFRRGVRHLDAIAQLLPEPANLLAALGVRPTGNQTVLPPIINFNIYLLIILMVLTVAAFLSDTFYILIDKAQDSNLIPRFLLVSLFVWLAYRSMKAIVERRGWLATVIGTVTSYFVLGVLIMIIHQLSLLSESNVPVSNIPVSFFVLFIWFLGGIISALLALTVYRVDYLRWLPWLPAKK